MTESVLQQIFALMITTDMPLTQDLSLAPKLGYLRFLSRSDISIKSPSRLKTARATKMFGHKGMPNTHSTIITLRAWASLRKQESSVSHYWISLCVSTAKLLLKPQFEVAYVPQMMKFSDIKKSGLMRRTLWGSVSCKVYRIQWDFAWSKIW